MASISLSSDISFATQPLHVVVPYDIPRDQDKKRFDAAMNAPLTLVAPTKEAVPFEIPDGLFSISFEQSGERPVAQVQWTSEGWDRLSYLYLTHMAKQVKTNPKSVPRSLRMFAKLMDKLPERPTGNGAVDTSRRIVIERNIEQIGPAVRAEVERRIKSWK